MAEKISYAVKAINDVVWGFPTIAMLIGCGIFFTVLLNFFQFTKIKLWLSNTLFSLFRKSGDARKSGKGGISQLQAVSTALASTIGTGNISGVATAIAAGGPGAVFWMWISACFGMMTCYSENVLGIYYRQSDVDGQWKGGPMYYIQNGLKDKKGIGKVAKVLSVLYCVFLIFASFGIGNMAQANSISASLSATFGFSVVVVGVVLAVVVILVTAGGIKSIGSVTEKLVPFMALFYIATTLFVFLSNYRFIPHVFASIFTNAFSLKAAFGAAGGIAVKKCVSMGFRRGIFSNEAGLGGSVTVSSCSNVKEPVKQGMWGIFQVFVDTIVVCTMTAFVLLSTTVGATDLDTAVDKLVSDPSSTQYVYLNEEKTDNGKVFICDTQTNRLYKASDISTNYTRDSILNSISQDGEYVYSNVCALKAKTDKDGNISGIKIEEVNGASLVTLAFTERFGKAASVVLSVAIVLFAFSTILGWSFYGTRAMEYLFGKKSVMAYKIIFALVIFVGCVSELSIVWDISDTFNGLMAIPNIIALLALSGTVAAVTKNYLRRKNGEKIKPMLSVYGDIQEKMEKEEYGENIK